MDREQAKNFIKTARAAGVSDDKITVYLKDKGVDLEAQVQQEEVKGPGFFQAGGGLDVGLRKAEDIATAIFPGEAIGEAIGSAIGLGGTAIGEKVGLMPEGATAAFPLEDVPTPLQVGGDIAAGAATVAGAKLPAAPGILPKVAQFGALGGVSGGGAALAKGMPAEQVVSEGLKAARTGAIVGGLTGVAEKGFKALGSLLGKSGEKIQTSVIKPSAKDLKDGFSIKNLNKHNLGGTLKQTADLADDALDDLGRQLNLKLYGVDNADEALKLAQIRMDIDDHIIAGKQILKELDADTLQKMGGEKAVVQRIFTNIKDGVDLTDLPQFAKIKTAALNTVDDAVAAIDDVVNPSRVIDMDDIMRITENKVLGEKAKGFGANRRIKRVLADLSDEITEITGDATRRRVPLPEAQLMKRSAGQLGAWQHGIPAPDAKANEKVYNAFYLTMKDAIEEASPEGVKEINKAMSEIIPIKNAVVRRIPVAERNQIIGLKDMITLGLATIDPRALGLTAANMISKSGKAGEILAERGVKAGEAAAKLANQLGIGARFAQTLGR